MRMLRVAILITIGLHNDLIYAERPWACGMKDLSLEEKAKDIATIEELRKSLSGGKLSAMNNGVVNIKTHVFIVHKRNGVGKLTEEAVDRQMQVMIDGFQGKVEGETSSYDTCGNFAYGSTTSTPFRFDIQPYKYIEDDNAFDMDSDDSETLRRNERIGDCSDLNIFFGDTESLGFAWFPQWCPSDVSQDAVVINYQFLPDNSGGEYTEGDTVVHEVGHWLGLLHTFDGGCAEGDGVEDTPAESDPAYGCPINRDTCGAPGEDPIHNYMDYTDDCCMYTFTEGQKERMLLEALSYRDLKVTPTTPISESPTLSPSTSHQPSKEYEDSCENDEDVELVLTLVTDDYGEETSWTLMDSASNVISKGGGYISNRKYTLKICLPSGDTYTFIIKDKIGDGICCDWGKGSYEGKLKNNVIFNGGAFGKLASHSFTVDEVSHPPNKPSVSSAPTTVPTVSSKPSTVHPTGSPSNSSLLDDTSWPTEEVLVRPPTSFFSILQSILSMFVC